MKDFLKILGFFIQLLVITLILTACFSGLYALVHVGDPRYKADRDQLWRDAGGWGIMMTGFTFLSVVGLAVISVIFHDATLAFIHANPQLITFGFISVLGTLALGLISGLVLLFNE